MDLHTLPFSGHFEDGDEVAEHLQLVEPENEAEQRSVGSAILEEARVVDDDHARRDYRFRYELGPHMGNGLFKLRVTASDASDNEHAVEIAAGLAMTGVTDEPDAAERIPMWFISKRILFKPVQGSPLNYPGPAFGRLHFPSPEALPQRRLFGASAL